MPRYKFYIDGIERTPTNVGAISINEELFTEAGAYFMRKKLSSSLQYTGKQDYQFFKSITDLCQRFTLEVKQVFASPRGEEMIYKGTFTVLNLSFNDTKCIAELEPETLDQHTCILKNWDKQFNVAQITDTSVITRVETGRSIQLAVGAGTVSSPPATVYSADPTAPTDPTQYGDPIESLEPQRTLIYFGGFLGDVDVNYVFYCREIQTTNCINGSPQSPAGAGWTQISANCTSSGGTSTWWRPFDYTSLFTFDIGAPTAVYPWSQARESPPPYSVPVPPEFEFIGTQLNTPPTVDYDVFFEREKLEEVTILIQDLYIKGGRDFLTVAERMLQANCGSSIGVSSDFFTADINPVTGTDNICKNLQLWTKSDVANAQISEQNAQDNIQATYVTLTLRELFQDVYTHTQCEWYILDQNPNNLIWEHITDVRDNTVGFDLTTYDGGKWVENIGTYRYGIEDVPLQEVWRFVTAENTDFIGLPIDYNGCGNEITNYNTNQIDTDLTALIGEAEQRGIDGFVLVQTDSVLESGSLAQNGILTGSFAPNMPLSISNLQDKFWRDYRKLGSGTLNGNLVIFNSRERIIEQEITFYYCDYNALDRRKLVRSQYGDGRIIKTQYNLKDQLLTLTLRFNF